MNYVILDIEWNGSYVPKLGGYFNEIIEIGAVMVDDSLQVVSEWSAVIRPVVSRKLTSLVRNLTGIEDADLTDGVSFGDALAELRLWINDADAVIMTWSTTDLLVILENCRYFFQEQRIPFMSYYADLQAYCQSRLELGNTQQLGLENACGLLGIEENELSHHRALDDSKLSARVFAKVDTPGRFAPFIKVADAEFYRWLTFKNTIVNDLNSPHVSSKDLKFHCEICGAPLIPEKDWGFRGRMFRVDMTCAICDVKYEARVQVKLKFDGPVTNRRIRVKPVEEPEAERVEVENGQEEEK